MTLYQLNTEISFDSHHHCTIANSCTPTNGGEITGFRYRGRTRREDGTGTAVEHNANGLSIICPTDQHPYAYLFDTDSKIEFICIGKATANAILHVNGTCTTHYSDTSFVTSRGIKIAITFTAGSTSTSFSVKSNGIITPEDVDTIPQIFPVTTDALTENHVALGIEDLTTDIIPLFWYLSDIDGITVNPDIFESPNDWFSPPHLMTKRSRSLSKLNPVTAPQQFKEILDGSKVLRKFEPIGPHLSPGALKVDFDLSHNYQMSNHHQRNAARMKEILDTLSIDRNAPIPDAGNSNRKGYGKNANLPEAGFVKTLMPGFMMKVFSTPPAETDVLNISDTAPIEGSPVGQCEDDGIERFEIHKGEVSLIDGQSPYDYVEVKTDVLLRPDQYKEVNIAGKRYIAAHAARVGTPVYASQSDANQGIFTQVFHPYPWEQKGFITETADIPHMPVNMESGVHEVSDMTTYVYDVSSDGDVTSCFFAAVKQIYDHLEVLINDRPAETFEAYTSAERLEAKQKALGPVISQIIARCYIAYQEKTTFRFNNLSEAQLNALYKALTHSSDQFSNIFGIFINSIDLHKLCIKLISAMKELNLAVIAVIMAFTCQGFVSAV
jgi:hypothetical protein